MDNRISPCLAYHISSYLHEGVIVRARECWKVALWRDGVREKFVRAPVVAQRATLGRSARPRQHQVRYCAYEPANKVV